MDKNVEDHLKRIGDLLEHIMVTTEAICTYLGEEHQARLGQPVMVTIPQTDMDDVMMRAIRDRVKEVMGDRPFIIAERDKQ